MEMKYENKLLVDCFLKFEDKYYMIKRRPLEKWLPGTIGSLWHEVPNKHNPYNTLMEYMKVHKVKIKGFKLKALANNVFHDLKETFYVYLFIVELKEKPSQLDLFEAEEHMWMSEKELLEHELVMDEYKELFPRLKKEEIMFYHSEYEDNKLINIEFFN